MVILTIAAWLYARHRAVKGKYPIKLLGPVPRGFKNIGAPHIDQKLLTALAPDLPLATIVLLLEHIAISKCELLVRSNVPIHCLTFSFTAFGRINNYKIDPNQELIAIGVTNTVGSVFHAYPATGSFSRVIPFTDQQSTRYNSRACMSVCLEV
jgi:solute carrier family 26 (sodium-independent sulfate anion transporter), member 11